MYFLVNTSPNLLKVATSNFEVHSLHNVAVTEHASCDLLQKIKVKGQ